MVPRMSVSIKGMDAEATSHIRKAVAGETVTKQDTFSPGMAPRKSIPTQGTDAKATSQIRKAVDGEIVAKQDTFSPRMAPHTFMLNRGTDAIAESQIRKAVAIENVTKQDTNIPNMAPRKSISTKGTDAKATSHIRKAVAGETVAEDTVEQIIEFASTILEQPSKAEMTVLNEGTENISRSIHILDSIANISLPSTKGEVVAIGVQVGKTDIRLLVASNNSLPDSTITHMTKIWNLLKQLSKDFDAVPGNFAPPRPKDLSQNTVRGIFHLRERILRFNHLRMRRRVWKYYSTAMSLHEHQVKKLGLKDTVTQLKALKKALDQRAPANETWDSVWSALRRICFHLAAESETIRKIQNSLEIPFNLHRYLWKIVSICQDTNNLIIQATRHPLKELLRRDFQIINVKGSEGIPSNALNSCAEWTQLVGDILKRRNMAAEEAGLVRFEMDETEVRQDSAEMCETPHRKAKFVHCELKIVSHVLQSSEKGFLDYIGLSKLSCEGCVHFMRAVESVSGARFRVKNVALTFDYPWAFPDIPHASSVAERMGKTVSSQFGRTYNGFRRENKRYHSDSDHAP